MAVVEVPGSGRADVPRRDVEARARLSAVGAAKAPLVLARDRSIAVPGPLAAVVPSVQRGTVVAVGGAMGSGATSTVLGFAAAATAVGEWAAVVDGSGSLGGLAAAAAGVDLARLAVVRDVPRDRWSTVVAALLDGVTRGDRGVAARHSASVTRGAWWPGRANAPRCWSRSRPRRVRGRPRRRCGSTRAAGCGRDSGPATACWRSASPRGR